MRIWCQIKKWLLLTAVIFLCVVGVSEVGAQEDPEKAHSAITKYTGPEVCADCHMESAQEVVESLHYQHQGEVPYREGWEQGVLGGMYDTY